MADRIHMLASALSRQSAARDLVFALLWLLALAPCARAEPAVPYIYMPRAHLLDVKRAFVHSGTAPLPGAGLRSFREPESGSSGTERFEIHWYANPPGIPPGVVVLLESLQEHSAVVKNHVLCVNEKSEGNIRSVIEIPADEILTAGRVLKWRVRVVWRGRLLASRTSENWDG
jgi:hypothetical protein